MVRYPNGSRGDTNPLTTKYIGNYRNHLVRLGVDPRNRVGTIQTDPDRPLTNTEIAILPTADVDRCHYLIGCWINAQHIPQAIAYPDGSFSDSQRQRSCTHWNGGDNLASSRGCHFGRRFGLSDNRLIRQREDGAD